MTDLPESFAGLFDLAQREPERLRARLAESPPRAERSRIESALSGADAMRRDDQAIAADLAHPQRLAARFLFWHDLDTPPNRERH